MNQLHEVRARKGKAHDIGANNHRQPSQFRQPGQKQGESQRQRGNGRWRLEVLQHARETPCAKQADGRRANPEAERLGGNPGNMRNGKSDTIGLRSYHAHHNRQDDNAQNVVKHRRGQNGNAFGRVQLAALPENTGADAYGCGRCHRAQEERLGVQPPIGNVEPNGAASAEVKGNNHAANPHQRARHGIAQEGGKIRLQTGEKQQNNRGKRGQRIEFAGNRMAGGRHREKGADDRPFDVAQSIGANNHPNDQFTQNTRQIQPAPQPMSTQSREDNQDAELKNKLKFGRDHGNPYSVFTPITSAALLRGWLQPSDGCARLHRSTGG